jgi:hypothetical protein
LWQPIAAQSDSTKLSYENQASQKIQEISKSITLVSAQVVVLSEAYIAHQKTTDSITANLSANAKQAAKQKLRADKTWHNTLMSTLTNSQRLKYLTVLATPKATKETAIQLNRLRQSGRYSETELQQKQKEILGYQTKEQIIILRDKYNGTKKRENLAWLRRIRPASEKEAELLEELQDKGQLTDGKINW